jgi:nitrogen-specific signal transduction histidine kinase
VVGGARRKVLTTKVPIFGPDGKATGIVGISRDITDLTQAEEERARLQEQLQQSQKMEAVGRLAGGIAHDFNNILTVIAGYCEMALEESQGSAAVTASLQEIKRAARRSASLVSQLLAFSRRQILLPRIFDLGGLAEGMEGMLRRLLSEDVRLVVLRAPVPLLVNADRGRIEQVVMNLAVNARDAMSAGGTLSISAIAETAPDGEMAALSVSDTGHGMDTATLGRLYEPFFTTKAVGKGTGLGLATVYGIVRQSSGTITCASEVGKGTTFTVRLPRVKGPADAAEHSGGGEGARRGTERVLLVEDDESVRRFVQSILAAAGYEVVTADSGAAALALLESLPAPPHILLTGVVMPGMDGRVLANEVQRRLPGVHVLLMSGYAEVVEGLSEPLVQPSRLIQKPFSAAELLSTMRAAVES